MPYILVVLDAGKFRGAFLIYLSIYCPNPQDASASRDEEFVRHLNHFLEDPEYIPVWDTRPAASASTSQPSTSYVVFTLHPSSLY